MVKTVFPLTEKILVHNPYARMGPGCMSGCFHRPRGVCSAWSVLPTSSGMLPE